MAKYTKHKTLSTGTEKTPRDKLCVKKKDIGQNSISVQEVTSYYSILHFFLNKWNKAVLQRMLCQIIHILLLSSIIEYSDIILHYSFFLWIDLDTFALGHYIVLKLCYTKRRGEKKALELRHLAKFVLLCRRQSLIFECPGGTQNLRLFFMSLLFMNTFSYHINLENSTVKFELV